MKSRRFYSITLFISCIFVIGLLFGISGCGDEDCDCTCRYPNGECPDTPDDNPDNPPDNPPSDGTQVSVDFENLTAGSSVVGLGAVNSHLNIQAALGNARSIREGIATWGAYGAPGSNPMMNGCLGAPGGLTPVAGRGNAFSDLNGRHDYVFSFGPNESVKNFSITMLDFGDWNPNRQMNHEVNLTAYDANNQVVDLDTLSYTSSNEELPTTSSFGNLQLAGDACTAKVTQVNQEPGVWTFTVAGQKITRVELKISSGMDPNIAFDNIKFTLN